MMNKTYLSLLLGCITLFFTTGCKKDMMQYEGVDGLYFDVRRGAAWLEPSTWGHQFFSEVAFGNMMEDQTTIDLVVRASGSVKDYDRMFQVVINNDSTTATQGTDFTGLDNHYVIKAGATSTVIRLQVNRTPAMHGDTLRLQLKLLANEHFQLMYQHYQDYPGTYAADEKPAFDGNKDASMHNIFFHDVLTRPTGWMGNDQSGGGLFGQFTEKKYRLMMELTQTTISDYAKEKMPTARATAIGQKMAVYLLEKAKQKDPVLEEDGTMMYFMAIDDIGGSAAWRPFTLPKDYYK